MSRTGECGKAPRSESVGPARFPSLCERARRPLLSGDRAAAGKQGLLQPHHRLRMRLHGVDDIGEKGAFGNRRETRLMDDLDQLLELSRAGQIRHVAAHFLDLPFDLRQLFRFHSMYPLLI